MKNWRTGESILLKVHNMKENDFDRASAKWMKREDERILEFLAEEGLASHRLISREAFEKVSAAHVAERLAMLEYAGLCSRTGWESYELTKEGKEYLNGDLDASHQPTPTVDRVLRS